MLPYKSGILLSVASPGKGQGDECDALMGGMRSRSGAKLKYVTNDIEIFGRESPTYGGYCEGELIYEKLLNPTVALFKKTLVHLIRQLIQQESLGREKYVLNLIYAGHGRNSDGGLELSDGVISGQELHELIASHYGERQNKLHVDLIIDSCYSGRFLIDFIVSSQTHDTVYAYDCVVSSLPDEKSYELDYLEHGALSFALSHSGNAHVDSKELARAVDSRDHKAILKFLQGVTIPNPVAFLTNGRQHSLHLDSGHLLSVAGAGSIELSDHIGALTHEALSDAISRARTNYGGETLYSS